MCIICDVKKQGEAIHREMETELSLAQAQINMDNATAVNKLVEAADVLGSMGRDELADRVLLALEKILPKREERRTGEVNTAAAGPSPVDVKEPVNEFAGMPPQLKAYVDEMRAKGFTIEVVNLGTL